MKIVDVHSHLLEKESIRALSGDILPVDGGRFTINVLGKSIKSVKKGFFDVQARKLDMDTMQISAQVLSATHHLFGYSLPSHVAIKGIRVQNDGIAATCKSEPDLFSGNAILPLQDTTESIKEVDRAYSDLELQGIEIGTNVAGKNPDQQELFPLYEKIQDLDIPIFIHPSDFHELGSRMEKYHMGPVIGAIAETNAAVTSMMFGGVFDNFPKLKAIFCHGGGALPFQIGRLKRATEVWNSGFNFKGDVVSSLKNIFFDTVVYDENSLNFLINQMGADKVLFGTDYPFSLFDPESVRKIIADSEIQDPVKEDILSDNSRKFYWK